MKKKGSLNLSMNAIVILILAITLLGLGLSFMRGLFKDMEKKVGVAISAQELTNPPTNDAPLTVAPSKLNLREGDSGEIMVAFMNVMPDAAQCSLEICESPETCIDEDNGLCLGNPEDDDCMVDIVYNPNMYSLKKDQINGYTLAIYAPSELQLTATTTLLYTLQMCCETGDADGDCSEGATGEQMFTKDLVVVVKP